MCIPVYNVGSYEYCRRVFVEVYVIVFIRFVKFMFFPLKFYNKIYSHGKFIAKFYLLIFFILSHMFPLDK